MTTGSSWARPFPEAARAGAVRLAGVAVFLAVVLATLPTVACGLVGGGDDEAEAEAGGSGKKRLKVAGKKVGRNDPCPCGSGKKYKHCCGR